MSEQVPGHGRSPVERRIATADGNLSVFDWPADGPAVFLAHATGFHARCWDEVIRLLPGVRCLALDATGHGRSDKPEPPGPYQWDRMASAAADAVSALGIRGAVGVGHSMGGYLVTRVAASIPGAFASLLLVDPSILAPEAYGRVAEGAATSFVARRRNEWASVEEMVSRFSGGPPFGHWRPEVLEDYCRYGLLPNGRGSFSLACPPQVEAAIYGATAGASPYEDIARVAIPVRILRAKQRPAGVFGDMSYSPTAPGLAAHFQQAEDILLEDYTHYMPMEDPAMVARHIREMLGAPVPGRSGWTGAKHDDRGTGTQ